MPVTKPLKIEINLPRNTFYNIFEVRGAWYKGKLLKGGVVEKRLRTTGVDEYAYYANKLRQNVGLARWIWRQTVTSQTAHIKWKWPPYATEWKSSMKIFCVRRCQKHINVMNVWVGYIFYYEASQIQNINRLSGEVLSTVSDLLPLPYWFWYRNENVREVSIMGVEKGGRGSWPPWILKILAKKGCFLSFEWEKTNFATFGLP